MLPCRRRVHVHKSASFKTIFEQILNIYENDAKTNPRMIETSIWKSCFYQKYAKLSDVGSRFKPFAWLFPAVARLFRDLFSESLGPLGPI